MKGKSLKFLILLACGLCLVASPALAEECTEVRYAKSKQAVERAFEGGIFLGSQTVDNRLQLFVDGSTWRNVPPDVRINMVDMVQCAVAGAGSALASLDVVTADSQRLVARIRNGRVSLVTD